MGHDLRAAKTETVERGLPRATDSDGQNILFALDLRLIDSTPLWDLCGFLPTCFGLSQQVECRVATDNTIGRMHKVFDEDNRASLGFIESYCGNGKNA